MSSGIETKRNYLIPPDLCTRCGACFAADRKGLLTRDDRGFPVVTSGTSTRDIEQLREVCSGENWNYRAMLDAFHGPEYPYDPASPDKGRILKLGIAYATNRARREAGQSGGVSTTIAASALSAGLIDAMLMVRRPDGSSGKSPFASEPFIARTVDEVLQAAGSKYTICASLEMIPELERTSERYGLSLLPCQSAGYRRLVMAGQVDPERCRLIIGPFCGFNMEASAGEELAAAAGLDPQRVQRFANRAGTFPGKTRFTTADGYDHHLDRTAHRPLYRMFAPTRCWTCTDFTNELSDLSIADCWRSRNREYEYPEGAAWVLVRTTRGEEALTNAIQKGDLEFHETPLDANDQHWRESILHRKVRAFNRIEALRRENIPVPRLDYPAPQSQASHRNADKTDLFFLRAFRNPAIKRWFLHRWVHLYREKPSRFALELREYLGNRAFTHRSNAHAPVRIALQVALLSAKHIIRVLRLGFLAGLVKSIFRSILQLLKALVRFAGYARPLRPALHLRVKPKVMQAAQQWGSYRPAPYPRILNASGHGYGNVGDEAQLGACLARWKKVEPDCAITVFSPNPGFTSALHEVPVAWAPRVAWFQSNTGGNYSGDLAFQWRFIWIWLRLNITARCMRAGIPFMLANADEAEILRLVQTHDVLHISGGGFLTGMTRSRLWENCLLIRCAQLLGTPVLLTGHNIGVFRNVGDRFLSRLAFRGVKYIGLRDGDQSPAALKSIGIRDQQIHADCDDALLFDPLPPAEVADRLHAQGVDTQRSWVAVNFHWWGQPENERGINEARFAEVCDYLATKHDLLPVFVSMVPTDHPANLAVHSKMKQPAVVLDYCADHRYVRGVIAGARMVFTMKHHPIIFAQGEGVPSVAVALDDYYAHKNKGALGNCGHARFVVERAGFFGPEVFTRIDEARSQDQQLRAELSTYIAMRKNEELTPYQRSNWAPTK